jgi:hypothetical protein
LNRTIATVMVALAAVLAAIGLLGGGEEETEPAATERPPSIREVARKVERVRELRFERLPKVEVVSAEQARADGLRELDEQVTPDELRAEERLLKLLGLIPADSSLRELFGEAMGGEVGGYYVPSTGKLALVRGQLGGLFRDVTLAHELTHALEDQHYRIDPHGATGFRRDRGIAEAALREGTATIAMVDYVVLDQTGQAGVPARFRREFLDELGDVALPASSGLPRYVREQLIFPYAAGAVLVNRIEGVDGWEAVNQAFRDGRPVSSEQVMHPDKFFAEERPTRVRVPALDDELPRGARPMEQGDLGEFDTEQLLRDANGRARSSRAAAGWGGGAFALWELPAADGCDEPCRDGFVLVMRWVWDTERDAREFERAARRTARALGGVVARAGAVTTFVLAPRGERQLSRVALR